MKVEPRNVKLEARRVPKLREFGNSVDFVKEINDLADWCKGVWCGGSKTFINGPPRGIHIQSSHEVRVAREGDFILKIVRGFVTCDPGTFLYLFTEVK